MKITNKRTQFYLASSLVLIGLIILYKIFDPLQYFFFPKCPIKSLTGLDCPGCGGQRATHLLLNGEFKAAFFQNPLLFRYIFW